MLEFGGLSERRHVPVQLPQPAVDGRVARANVTQVALEVLDIDRIEADDGGEEADVGLGDVFAKVVGAGRGGEVGFSAVEGGEELLDVAFVGFLRPGEGSVVRRYLLRARSKVTYVAKPDLYTPLLMSLYVHPFVSSILFLSASGKRSSFLYSSGSWSSNS